jgi:hypothetical protein
MAADPDRARFAVPSLREVSMLPAALTVAVLALAAHSALPEHQAPTPPAGAEVQAAEVVWRYDTGG